MLEAEQPVRFVVAQVLAHALEQQILQNGDLQPSQLRKVMRPLNRHGVVRYGETLLRIYRQLAQYLLGVLQLPLGDVHRPDGIERPVTKLHQEEAPEGLVKAPPIVVWFAR